MVLDRSSQLSISQGRCLSSSSLDFILAPRLLMELVSPFIFNRSRFQNTN